MTPAHLEQEHPAPLPAFVPAGKSSKVNESFNNIPVPYHGRKEELRVAPHLRRADKADANSWAHDFAVLENGFNLQR
eukprot:scaffold48271_cov30-Tisochrysis_lutea.AAC.3